MSLPPPSARQARLIWLAITGLALATLVSLVVALVWGLGRVVEALSPVLWPLAIGGIIACLLDPVVDFIELKSGSRPRAIIAVFALALVFVTTLFGSIVPQLVTETRDFAKRVPDYTSRLGQKIESWMNHPPVWLQRVLERQTKPAASPPRSPGNNPNVSMGATNLPPGASPQPDGEGKKLFETPIDQGTLESAANWLAGAVRKAGSWLFGRVASWFGVLAGVGLIPVYTFYFLL